MKHHLLLYWTRRAGCWSSCTCGWLSGRWTTTVGAHLEFGTHLLEKA